MQEENNANMGDIGKLSFEEALRELESVVQRLESGDAKLEDSIDLYTRGTLLKRVCEEKLDNARARIEKISVDTEGRAKNTEPLDGVKLK